MGGLAQIHPSSERGSFKTKLNTVPLRLSTKWEVSLHSCIEVGAQGQKESLTGTTKWLILSKYKRSEGEGSYETISIYLAHGE